MKTLLFINACMRGHSLSRTETLAQCYIDTLREHASLRIIERTLSKESFLPLTPKNFSTDTGQPILHRDFAFAKEFAEADLILIAAPFWEFAFPAALACYIEHISVSNITFQYTDKGLKGLCRAKHMRQLYTSGAFLQDGDNLGAAHLAHLCGMYGIPDFRCIGAEGLDIEGQDIPALLETAKAEVQKAALADAAFFAD